MGKSWFTAVTIRTVVSNKEITSPESWFYADPKLTRVEVKNEGKGRKNKSAAADCPVPELAWGAKLLILLLWTWKHGGEDDFPQGLQPKDNMALSQPPGQRGLCHKNSTKISGLQKRSICTQMAFQEWSLGPSTVPGECLGEAYVAWTGLCQNHGDRFSCKVTTIP